jgi:hypothetical protein
MLLTIIITQIQLKALESKEWNAQIARKWIPKVGA